MGSFGSPRQMGHGSRPYLESRNSNEHSCFHAASPKALNNMFSCSYIKSRQCKTGWLTVQGAEPNRVIAPPLAFTTPHPALPEVCWEPRQRPCWPLQPVPMSVPVEPSADLILALAQHCHHCNKGSMRLHVCIVLETLQRERTKPSDSAATPETTIPMISRRGKR